MTKKLKIRFAKFERALVVQQLEIEGIHHFVENMYTQFSPFYMEPRQCGICIQVKKNCFSIARRIFADNAERDEYLDKVVNWISEEQFATGGKLEIGKLCEFSDNGVEWHSGKYAGKCARELGEPRFLAAGSNIFVRFKNARPICGCIKPRIVDDIYTWEMEVSE